MTLAQAEADRLLNQKEKITSHPEDRQNSDSETTPTQSDGEGSGTYVHSDTETASSRNMVSKGRSYHVPTTTFKANTGPKGVIADAQSYEQAKKRSFRQALRSAAGLDSLPFSRATKGKSPQREAPAPEPVPDEDGDEQFMRKWRENRMQELQQRRHVSSRRTYGTVDAVCANGYLDAVEKVPADTVVVVCIYDPESTESSIVEECLNEIARKHPTIRFVKLHHAIAEMDVISAPAILAYRNGDVFATIVEIFDQIPRGFECNSASLENVLIQHRVC